MSSLVLAHASHWLVNLAYMLPVLAFLIWLGITTLRERREAAREAKGAARERKRKG